MQDAGCTEDVVVLLSTALVKPEENATEGDPDGIYTLWMGACVARLRAWQRQGIDPIELSLKLP